MQPKVRNPGASKTRNVFSYPGRQIPGRKAGDNSPAGPGRQEHWVHAGYNTITWVIRKKKGPGEEFSRQLILFFAQIIFNYRIHHPEKFVRRSDVQFETILQSETRVESMKLAHGDEVDDVRVRVR